MSKKIKNKILVNGKVFMPAKPNEEWLKEPARDESLKKIYNDDYFISLIPEGCNYFAIDEKNEKIYGLGFNYKEKMEKQITDLEAKLAESEKDRLMWQEMYKSADRQNKSICETDIYPLQEQVNQLKQQLADTEAQNKRVLEKLELIVKSNQELEQQLAETVKDYEELVNKQKQEIRECDKEDMRLRDYAKSLEQQLADMTKKYELASLPIGGLVDTARNLEQQLAEKEKELHYKTAECEKWKADYENCSKLEKIMTKEHQYCLDNWRASDKEKISFAVEQLEKVIEYIDNHKCKTITDDRYVVYRKSLVDTIYNQIKQLKEGK